MTESFDQPATNGADTDEPVETVQPDPPAVVEQPVVEPASEDPDAEHDAAVAVAQQRDVDPDGDPDAQDTGAAEAPADVDPEPALPESASDDFADLDEGADDDGAAVPVESSE